MDKIYIKVDKKTGMVYLDNTVIGRDNENLQQELIFSFENGFVSGSPRLEYKIANNKYHIPMEIDGENYKTPVKNILTKEGRVEMQLVIVEQEQDEEIPVFKSNVFYVYCNRSINAQEEAPDDYEYWLDVIQTKLASMDEALEEVDNLDIDVSKEGDTATVEITKKDGTTKSVEIYDGSGGGGGTSDYEDLTNKPSINNVELSGNKSLSDLGIQPEGNYLTSESDPTVPSHVKNISQADITSWNNKSDFTGSYNDLTDKPTIPDELSDLADDSTHRLVTDTEKTTWNGKQNTLIAGDNIIINNDIISAKDKVINVDLYKSTSTPLILEDLEVGTYMLKSSNMTSSETFYVKARATDTDPQQVILSDFSHYFPFYKLNEFESGKNAYAFMANSEMTFTIKRYDENSASGIGSSGSNDIYKYFRTARNQYNAVASNNDYSGANNYTTLPTSAVAPTSDNQFANKKYVDDQVAGAGGGARIFLIDFGTLTTSAQKIEALNEWYQYYKTQDTDWQLIWKNGDRNFSNPTVYEDTGKHKVYISFIFKSLNKSKNNGSTTENVACYSMGYIILSVSNDAISAIDDYGATFDTPYIYNYTGTPHLNVPLGTTNNFAYTPTNDYNPATKKYVDDVVEEATKTVDPYIYTLDLITLNKGINSTDFMEQSVQDALASIINQAYSDGVDYININIKFIDTIGRKMQIPFYSINASIQSKPDSLTLCGTAVGEPMDYSSITRGGIMVGLSWDANNTCTINGLFNAFYESGSFLDYGTGMYYIDSLISMIAPYYEVTETYSVGDCVVYNYALYKCITAVTSPEDFDDSKWQQTTLADIIKNL